MGSYQPRNSRLPNLVATECGTLFFENKRHNFNNFFRSTVIAAVATGPPVSKSSLLGFFGAIHDIQICPLFCIHASLCASRAEMPAPTGRRGGPRGLDHLWVSFHSGVGWSALLIALADISKLHCNGLALLPKGVAPNNEHLKYKYACTHHNTKGCTWFVLVYMAKQAQVPSSSRPTAHKDEP